MQINGRKSTFSHHLLSKEKIHNYMIISPYALKDLDDGLKYLGFNMKPNNYTKADWGWLIGKLEKMLHVWSFSWLSRSGQLVYIG